MLIDQQKKAAVCQHPTNHVCVQPRKAFVQGQCPMQKKVAARVNCSQEQQPQANGEKICMIQTDVLRRVFASATHHLERAIQHSYPQSPDVQGAYEWDCQWGIIKEEGTWQWDGGTSTNFMYEKDVMDNFYGLTD
ncbi:hypothetical protein Tco_1241732 [Tanacetum coccineum]